MFDPMSELTGGGSTDSFGMDGPAPAPRPPRQGGAPRPAGGGPSSGSGHGGGGGGRFATDLHSVTIHARQRTFYVDLKESGNGKFFKISEKSRGGQKTTIMFDVEDLDQIIAALQEMKTKL